MKNVKNYFLDTSFLLDLMKENDKAIEIHKKIKGRELTGTPCLYELAKFAQFDVSEFFRKNEVLEFDEQDAELAGEIYRKLEREGELIGEIDIIISGMVSNRNLVLVTRDNDFQNVNEIKLKLIE